MEETLTIVYILCNKYINIFIDLEIDAYPSTTLTQDYNFIV